MNATRPGSRAPKREGGVDSIPIYVRGRTDDPTDDWCRNCLNFPAVYAHATPNRPKAMLCPECVGLEQGGSCRQIEG